MKVSAKRKDGPSVEVEYDFGDNLKAMVEKFGEDIIFQHAKGSLVVALQGWLRSLLDREKTPADIQKEVKDWKPGQRRQGKTPKEKATEALAALSPEERAAVLKQMKAAAAG